MTAPHLQYDAVDSARVLPPRLDPRGSGPGRSGRGAGPGGPPPRRRRGLLAFLSLVSCCVLLVTVGGWAAYSFINGKVNRIDLGLSDGGSSGVGVANYLLVGTDSRAGTGGEYGDVEGQRSDTTILAHLDKDGTTTMISFPRDMYVTIPEYTDTNGKRHASTKDKFNAAISSGGPPLLVRTIESLTGMQVDHYISMDLQGFKKITDAIGGVEVCIKPSNAPPQRFQDDNGRWRVSTNTNDPMSGFRGGPGTIQVNGDQALAFVRQRHGLPAGDTDRISRQQQFIGAMFHKIMNGDTLSNPIKAERLVSTAAGALTLDEHTTIADLRGLATRIKGLTNGGIRMQTVPTHAPTRAEGAVDDMGDIRLHGTRASVQFYQPDDLLRIVSPLGGRVEGASSSGDAGAGAGPALAPGATAAPSQVRVTVYNGSSRSGLASQVTGALTSKGFHARNAGNASALTHVTSRVIYGPGQDAEARTVAAAVPGSSVLADSSVTGVQLVLGSGFTEVVTPSVSSSVGTSGAAPAPAAGTTAGGATAGVQGPTAPPEAPTCTY
ncbi:LCP family protein [Frankia sp. ACN1ag]|uniref:LCP family protein n=1 Tax=Frankia sp. ACN1ag TaxID=102891 RepID=UPI0006DC06FC|nr:LCP family protein [Frankia sp. ACN1ag]KQC39868.1 transcriptional regulator [Frankia sp. ACN1ag]